MKKVLFFCLAFLFISSFLMGYQVGDEVEDLIWQDSDGGEPVDRSLHNLTLGNKVVMIVFSATWCGHCVNAAPELQIMWEEVGGEYFHLVQTLQNVSDWGNLNGSTWRTKFDPPLTFWLSIGSSLYTPYFSVFGNGYIPYYIVIDHNNILQHSGNSKPTQTFVENLIREMNDGAEPVPVYRFFNHVRGGHLYTISEVERDYIMNNLPQWTYEGVKFNVNDRLVPDVAKAFRFFNTNTGIHFYTISETERDTIMELPQWNYEGVKYFVFTEQAAGTIPVYRFFNHVRGGHLYTISESERDDVMELPQWTYEGICFYVYP